MNKKTVVTAMLALFIFQTQAFAASADVEREILSGKTQSSIPHTDKSKKKSGSVILSRQEGDREEMSPADREREILGKSQKAVVVPVDEWQKDTEKKKKADKKKDKKKQEDTKGEADEQGEMHSSSMGWDTPDVSKNTGKKPVEESVEKNSKQADKSDTKERIKEEKKKKRAEMSLADLERMRLGGKSQPPSF